MPKNREESSVKPRVTLKTVAEAAGLGITTVSDILNGQEAGRIRYSKKTRDKVDQVVRELGYSVNQAAQQLRRGRSGVVGLLLTRHMHDTFFARTIDLAEEQLRDHGFQLQLAIGQGQGVEDRMRRIHSARVEGLLFGPAYDPQDIAPLKDLNVPTVVFGGSCGGQYDEVAIDHLAARRLAVSYLYEQGHRTVGFLEMHKPRWEQFDSDASIVRAAGLTGEQWWMENSNSQDPATVHRAALEFSRRWLAAKPVDRPTAVLCHDDHTATIALAAFWEAGIRVPEQLSVIGCNNIPATRYLIPPLTTIDLHVEKQMQTAVDRLVHRINNPTAETLVQWIAPDLVERKSVTRCVVATGKPVE
jgi:DNA-binding LacI/PurR family transcriptional regulator